MGWRYNETPPRENKVFQQNGGKINLKKVLTKRSTHDIISELPLRTTATQNKVP